MQEQDVPLNEASRQAIYTGLARCFQTPQPDLNEQIETMVQALNQLDSQAAPLAGLVHKNLMSRNTIVDLSVDFSKLFIGPYSLLAPPYGSIYLESERRIMGASTLDVVQFYKKAGLEVAEDHKDAPDHVSTELEFMAFLINEELRAMAKGKEDRFLNLLDVQKTFLHSHLKLWINPFAQEVKRGAQTDFYANLADATHIFVAEDVDYLFNLKLHEVMETYTDTF